jgi:hypothetical protein
MGHAAHWTAHRETAMPTHPPRHDNLSEKETTSASQDYCGVLTDPNCMAHAIRQDAQHRSTARPRRGARTLI